MGSPQSNVNQLSLCRLCLSVTDKLYRLFNSEETDATAISLPMKIFLCTTIAVSKGDTLPQQICWNCLNYINEWYSFRKKCKDVNLRLKQKLIYKEGSSDCDFKLYLKITENISASPHNLKDSEESETHNNPNEDIIRGATCTNSQNNKTLQINISETNSNNKNSEKTPNYIRKHKFKCFFCPDSFYYLKDLKLHKNLLHGLQNSLPTPKTLTFSDSEIKLEEMKIKSRYKMKCCDKIFFSKPKFQKHYREKHPGEKPFMCDICGKKDFISKETLKRHKILHSGKFKCEICSKSFTCNAILLLHKRDKHENDKPFICDTCGKCFVSKLLMNYHKRFHTGEKKYICEKCGVAVVTSSSLAKHRRVHNKEKPHICQICGKGFIIKGRLAEHLRVHTGERPYSCQICHKGFTINHKLKRHLLIHSGEKPFFCEYCGNHYSTKYGLSIHLKSHLKKIFE